MRFSVLTLVFLGSPATAEAHVGHLVGLAGHDHWVAGAAIGAAIAISIWTAAKGRGRDSETSEDEIEDGADVAEGQNARATRKKRAS